MLVITADDEPYIAQLEGLNQATHKHRSPIQDWALIQKKQRLKAKTMFYFEQLGWYSTGKDKEGLSEWDMCPVKMREEPSPENDEMKPP